MSLKAAGLWIKAAFNCSLFIPALLWQCTRIQECVVLLFFQLTGDASSCINDPKRKRNFTWNLCSLLDVCMSTPDRKSVV